ncbi:MAG TPA: DinB family protein, partial [Pyrinomonadaceae bacterium]|nr:DinB family protein [Pyrinomonadaceae bacterium]
AHLNGFYRIKMTLTEDSPMIVPYDASKWAELGDQTLTIDPSLKIFEGVHSRLSAIFQDLSDSQFERKAINLESGEWTVEGFLALYAWHARHHTAHITNLRERNGW